jgi:hypothetical protein
MNKRGIASRTVEPHVLGKRLGQQDVVAVVEELADGERVLVRAPGGETLVRHVEKRHQVPLLDDLRQLGPLLGLRVDAGRVVGAGVQQDDRLLRNFLNPERERGETRKKGNKKGKVESKLCVIIKQTVLID